MSTALETVLTKKVLKDSLAGLKPRIETLHKQGWISDADKKDLLARSGTISLSVADIDPKTGEVRPNMIEIELKAIERLAKSGKPGPFAKSTGTPANPNKPISTAVSLSTANDDHLVPEPYAHDEDSAEAQRKRGEAAGDELAAMAGASTSKK